MVNIAHTPTAPPAAPTPTSTPCPPPHPLHQVQLERCLHRVKPSPPPSPNSAAERFTTAAGKLAHFGLMLGVPAALHGPGAMLAGFVAYAMTQSIVLSTTFAVSHNVGEAKPLEEGPTQDNLLQELAERDWGVQQILTSANWGGVIGNFFTGGLNLQVGAGCGAGAGVGVVGATGLSVEDVCGGQVALAGNLSTCSLKLQVWLGLR